MARVSGTDITIEDDSPDYFSMFGNAIAQGIEQAPAERIEKSKREMERVEYYAKLRDAGYSEAEAAEKVNKDMKKPFLERMFNRSESFTAPTGYDKQARAEAKARLEAEKEKAGIAKTEAETKKAGAETDKARAETQQTLRETEEGQNVYTVDDEGNLQHAGKVPKGSKVVKPNKKATASGITPSTLANIAKDEKQPENIREAARTKLAELLAQDLGMDPAKLKANTTIIDRLSKFIGKLGAIGGVSAGSDILEQTNQSLKNRSASSAEGRIKMQKPDGSVVLVSQADYEKAKSSGYKEA